MLLSELDSVELPPPPPPPPGVGFLGWKDFPDPVAALSSRHPALSSPALVSGGS